MEACALTCELPDFLRAMFEVNPNVSRRAASDGSSAAGAVVELLPPIREGRRLVLSALGSLSRLNWKDNLWIAGDRSSAVAGESFAANATIDDCGCSYAGSSALSACLVGKDPSTMRAENSMRRWARKEQHARTLVLSKCALRQDRKKPSE